MPPGAAILCIRAAILTPSPKISLPADIDANAELDRVASVKDSIVLANVVLDLDPQATASTALANSTSTPSPISLTTRPEWAAAGQTWTSEDDRITSAHPSITDIKRTLREVRHGPKTDVWLFHGMPRFHRCFLEKRASESCKPVVREERAGRPGLGTFARSPTTYSGVCRSRRRSTSRGQTRRRIWQGVSSAARGTARRRPT